jgi:RNA binding exosome subunit
MPITKDLVRALVLAKCGKPAAALLRRSDSVFLLIPAEEQRMTKTLKPPERPLKKSGMRRGQRESLTSPRKKNDANSELDLSSKAPVAYVDVRLSAHATEDVDKVLRAILNVLREGSEDKVVFKKETLTGHYGNEIVLIRAKIQDKSVIEHFFGELSQGLSILDKDELYNRFEDHFERGNLYLRLDKQAAFLKKIRLRSVDPIHLRIHFKNPGKNEVSAVCRRLGLIP